MKLPVVDSEIRTVLIREYDIPELGKILVEAVPSWPCYGDRLDGMNTNLQLEMRLVTKDGAKFRLVETKEDE